MVNHTFGASACKSPELYTFNDFINGRRSTMICNVISNTSGNSSISIARLSTRSMLRSGYRHCSLGVDTALALCTGICGSIGEDWRL